MNKCFQRSVRMLCRRIFEGKCFPCSGELIVFFWKFNSFGIYSVKLGYHLLAHGSMMRRNDIFEAGMNVWTSLWKWGFQKRLYFSRESCCIMGFWLKLNFLEGISKWTLCVLSVLRKKRRLTTSFSYVILREMFSLAHVYLSEFQMRIKWTSSNGWWGGLRQFPRLQ